MLRIISFFQDDTFYNGNMIMIYIVLAAAAFAICVYLSGKFKVYNGKGPVRKVKKLMRKKIDREDAKSTIAATSEGSGWRKQ